MMEDIKDILSNEKLLSILNADLIQNIILDSIKANNKFRNTQRVFGFFLAFPFLVVGFSEMFLKVKPSDFFWWGTLAMLAIGMSFFFPKQSEPLLNAIQNKILK